VGLDQSRIQPWLLEYAVIAGAMLAGAVTPATRLFFVGLYAFAGLHKLNYGFVMLLAEMLQPLWQPGPKVLGPLAVVAALWEAGWGVALAFRRTRRLAALALIVMHLALLALLGPWALNLNRSVWAWNVVNIVVLALLFWRDWNWQWDLNHSPLYPEPRIYRAVGRQVAVWLKWGDAVRVLQFSRPDRFTGQRQVRSYDPLTQ
jgi:hypothetical protein